ncbi:MAG TPA: hypothetical protein VMJ10_02790 [Kofleriaceae bacterium]|nr:hypothetical protein [Kofleriaceae bacterium]
MTNVLAATALCLAACGRIDFPARIDGGDGPAPSTGLADLVQQSVSFTAPGSTATAAFFGSQRAGDTNVVVVGWTGSPSDLASVQDSAGNTYEVAAAPAGSGPEAQAIYYATDIAAAAPGTNTVTVSFNAVPTTMPDVRMLEYTGLAAVASVDIAQTGTGDDATDPTVSVATSAPDLIVAAVTSSAGCSGVGGGYRVRLFDDHANTAQDLDAATPATYSAGCQSAATQAWVAQAVAFRTDASAQRSPYTIRQTGEDESGSGVARIYGDQLAGDTMFVMIAWSEASSSVASVTDTAGNAYTPIAGFPATYSGMTMVTAYYARDIAAEPATANATITATFTPPLATGVYGGVYALELAGVDHSAPLDDDIYQVCNGTTSCASGMLDTHFGPELLVTPEMTSASPDVHLPGPGYGLGFFNSASTGSSIGTVFQFATEPGPGSFETSYRQTTGSDWLQSLFAFH